MGMGTVKVDAIAISPDQVRGLAIATGRKSHVGVSSPV